MDERDKNLEEIGDLDEFDDENAEGLEEDFIDDYESDDGYIESEDPFIHGYQRGNRFIQGNNGKNNFFNRNNSGSNDNSLQNNIKKQAKDNPNKINTAKNGNNASSDDVGKRMSQARNNNTMNSIHNNQPNNKKSNDEKKSTPGNGGDIKGAAQNAGTKIAAKAIQSKTGMPSDKAEKMVNTAMQLAERQKKIRKYKIIAACIPIIVVLLVVLSSCFSDEDEKNSNKDSISKDYYSGVISDEELYSLLIENDLIGSIMCEDDNGNFNNDCDVIKFFNIIKEGVDDQSQFSTIYLAISYNRDPDEYYVLYDSEELQALLNNKNSFSSYLNGDYLSIYRKDIDPDFDLYSYIKNIILSNQTFINYKVCDNIVVDGIEEPINFEDYIAGVVKYEISSDQSIEAIKAMSIIVRSYAYSETNGCEKSISNTGEYQIYEPIDINDTNDKRIVEIVNSTSGMVIENSSRKILSPNYDNFCYGARDNENYYLVQKDLSIPISWVESKNFESLFPRTYDDLMGNVRSKGYAIINCTCNSTTPTSACTDKSGKYMSTGYPNGFSKYGAVYLAEQGKSYEEILKFFYGDDIIIDTLSSEFTVNSNTGFKMRTSRSTRDNPYFYTTSNVEYPSLEGECVWYAYGRANEIIDQWKSEGKNVIKYYNIAPNGGDTCQAAKNAGYKTNTGLNNIEEGSVISWKYGQYGHVAIVEKVNDDGSIEISEGGLAYFRLGIFASSPSTIVNKNNGSRIDVAPYLGNIWSSLNYVSRSELCETNGSGCQNYEILPGGIYSGTTPVCTIPLSQFVE